MDEYVCKRCGNTTLDEEDSDVVYCEHCYYILKRRRVKRHYKQLYVRAATFPVEEILPKIFTLDKQRECRKSGIGFRAQAKQKFKGIVDGREKELNVKMASHRYQLFAEKGITCVNCGIEGEYFALERHNTPTANKNSYHFNLYGKNEHGIEVMLTKDHIIPRSKGGPNKLSNYQTMCKKCNGTKGDKL